MLVNKKKLIKKELIKKELIKKELIKKELLKKEKENNIISKFRKLNKPFVLKKKYNINIPLDLYTCWHTKDLPPLMKKNYNFLVESNPEIRFHLFDDTDCREFIKEHFEEDVLRAFDSLIPGAYKADLWRYCVLFIKGGIYLDIKYRCVNGFKFVDLTENEYFVRDRPKGSVYNALIISLPQNEIIEKCIYNIVENVKNKYYGPNPLYPTGPGLLGKYFSNDKINSFELYFGNSFIENKLEKYYIVKNDKIILTYYDDYRKEQRKFEKVKHYHKLWNEKNIYN